MGSIGTWYLRYLRTLVRQVRCRVGIPRIIRQVSCTDIDNGLAVILVPSLTVALVEGVSHELKCLLGFLFTHFFSTSSFLLSFPISFFQFYSIDISPPFSRVFFSPFFFSRFLFLFFSRFPFFKFEFLLDNYLEYSYRPNSTVFVYEESNHLVVRLSIQLGFLYSRCLVRLCRIAKFGYFQVV
jgi:hypothetical protein